MTAKRIQDVALKYFALKGYDGTTLSEIAGEVGIKKPSIYAHFNSKNELFFMVVQDVAQGYYEFWKELLIQTESLDYEQRLFGIFKTIVEHFGNDNIKMAFWIRNLVFPPTEYKDELLLILKNLNNDILEEITKIFTKGISVGAIRSGVARDMAYAYLCLLDGYLMRRICAEDKEAKQHMEQMWKSFWSGTKC